MRRPIACSLFALALFAGPATADAACREVWLRDSGPGGQVRKQTVCSDGVVRPGVEARVRELERRERRRNERERWERWEQPSPPVIVLPPPRNP